MVGIDNLTVGENKGLHLSEVKLKLSRYVERLKCTVGVFPNALSRMHSRVLFVLLNLDSVIFQTIL
jgi:hypothetical protein